MSEVGQSDAATGNGEAPVKTAKQLEKEAKKAEKLAKLQEKQKKLAEKKATEPAEKEVSSCVRQLKWQMLLKKKTLIVFSFDPFFCFSLTILFFIQIEQEGKDERSERSCRLYC